MARRTIVSAVLLLVLHFGYAVGFAAPQPKAIARLRRVPSSTRIGVPRISFEKYKLRNGLEVILSEDHRLPLVTVYVLYHVGPVNERPGLTGFAHLFEHLMFEGSLHVGEKAHFKILEEIGAQQFNGTTDLDHTKYFETVPSNELETALWLESDRMGFLLEKLDEAKLANQRDVVRNERRQKIENEPYGLAEVKLYHLLFPKDHPYYADVIGSHADIEAARLRDAWDFFNRYYAPNNASIAIVGDINKHRTRELVQKYFGPLPMGPAVPKVSAVTPPIRTERRESMTDKVELPRVYMAWITDPIFQPGNAEEELLAQILAGAGKTSRLYKKLVYEKQIAQDVLADQTSLELGSVFTIQATARPGVKPEELESAIQEELVAIQKRGPRPDELEAARNVIESRILRSMETTGGESGVAGRLSRYNHHLGTPGFLPLDIERYEHVTVRDLQRVAWQKLASNARAVLYCIPGLKITDDVPRTVEKERGDGFHVDAVRAAFEASQSWRDVRPEPGPSPVFALPIPERFTLPNGLTVLLLQRHDLPLFAASLFVLSGNEANPGNQPGLATFMTRMLEQGTSKRSALQLAADASQIGAQITTKCIADFSGITVQAVGRHADSALDLLSDLALNPAFRPEEIERVRAEQLTALLQERNNGPRLALRVFYRLAYGEKHPYGHMELGTEPSIRKITRDDLVHFWASGYVPGNAVLAVVGDITFAQARSLAQKHFGSWRGPAQHGIPPEVHRLVTSRAVIVDKPSSPQTALLVGAVGVTRASPDYVPVELTNNILGGLVSSRLNTNLREKHGYTYGAFSQFVYRRAAGPFFVRTSVRTDVTGAAMKETLDELNGIRMEPPSPAELRVAKNSMVRSLPSLFDTTQQAARSIGDLFIYGLPLDYYRTLPARVEAVDAAEVERTAQKYVHPDSMIVIAVGDRGKIERQIKELNLGPIEVRDRSGDLQAEISAKKAAVH